jgi:hypothetical protein
MEIFEHPLTGEKIQVAAKDFSNDMTWSQAIQNCESLGQSWRLPTKEETEAMFFQLHKKGVGNFENNVTYWSSSEYNEDEAWFTSFDDGCTAVFYKNSTYYVRAVKYL